MTFVCVGSVDTGRRRIERIQHGIGFNRASILPRAETSFRASSRIAFGDHRDESQVIRFVRLLVVRGGFL